MECVRQVKELFAKLEVDAKIVELDQVLPCRSTCPL